MPKKLFPSRHMDEISPCGVMKSGAIDDHRQPSMPELKAAGLTTPKSQRSSSLSRCDWQLSDSARCSVWALVRTLEGSLRMSLCAASGTHGRTSRSPVGAMRLARRDRRVVGIGARPGLGSVSRPVGGDDRPAGLARRGLPLADEAVEVRGETEGVDRRQRPRRGRPTRMVPLGRASGR